MTPYLKPGLMDIDDIVAEAFGIEKRFLNSRSRLRPETDARSFAMWYRHEYNGESTTQAGKAYGRDHSTVIFAKKTVVNLMETDKVFREKAEEALKILEQIKN